MGDLFFPPWRWGIFQRAACTARLISQHPGENNALIDAYLALLKKGFRQTNWQYVYKGQVGGLVRGYGGNAIEVHIRFFDGDRIYAEIEIGRHGLAHFFMGRRYANEFIFGLLGADLTAAQQSYLRAAAQRYKESTQVRMLEWRPSQRFIHKNHNPALSCFTSWKTVSSLLLLGAVMSDVDGFAALKLPIALAIVAYVFARGKKF